jgi:hypothetical protein
LTYEVDGALVIRDLNKHDRRAPSSCRTSPRAIKGTTLDTTSRCSFGLNPAQHCANGAGRKSHRRQQDPRGCKDYRESAAQGVALLMSGDRIGGHRSAWVGHRELPIREAFDTRWVGGCAYPRLPGLTGMGPMGATGPCSPPACAGTDPALAGGGAAGPWAGGAVLAHSAQWPRLAGVKYPPTMLQQACSIAS